MTFKDIFAYKNKKVDLIVFFVFWLLSIILSKLNYLQYISEYIFIFFIWTYWIGRTIGYYYGKKEQSNKEEISKKVESQTL